MFLPLGSMLGAEATISNSRLVMVIAPVMSSNLASTNSLLVVCPEPWLILCQVSGSLAEIHQNWTQAALKTE